LVLNISFLISTEPPFRTYSLTANGVKYTAEKPVGSGSFGVVVKAVVQETSANCIVKLRVGDVVAIKKVLQDRKYKVLA
jgi:hypothetical protein